MKTEPKSHYDEHGMTEQQVRAVQQKYGAGPFITVDMVIVTVRWDNDDRAPRPQVLTIRRKNPPFQGWLALPGGFVDMDENLEQAARRELNEETGVTLTLDTFVQQLAAFGTPNRDPRGRNVSVAHLALVPWSALSRVQAGDDASEAEWLSLRDGALFSNREKNVPLAFDHELIVLKAWEQLRDLTLFTPAHLIFLPVPFDAEQLDELQTALGNPDGPTASDLVDRGWAKRDETGDYWLESTTS